MAAIERMLERQLDVVFSFSSLSGSSPTGSAIRGRLLQAARARDFTPRFRNVHASFTEHTGYVAAGLGVALVPAAMAACTVEGVAFRPLAEAGLRLETWLHWRADAEDPSVQDFVDSIMQALSEPEAEHA